MKVAVLPNATMVATPWHGFDLYEHADGAAAVFLELIHRTDEITRDRSSVASVGRVASHGPPLLTP